jgi:hypothetical protein
MPRARLSIKEIMIPIPHAFLNVTLVHETQGAEDPLSVRVYSGAVELRNLEAGERGQIHNQRCSNR